MSFIPKMTHLMIWFDFCDSNLEKNPYPAAVNFLKFVSLEDLEASCSKNNIDIDQATEEQPDFSGIQLEGIKTEYLLITKQIRLANLYYRKKQHWTASLK